MLSATLLLTTMGIPLSANALADASISGTIRSAADSQPIADAEVELFDAAGDGTEPALTVTTNAAGEYSAENLEPGTYRVRASGDPALFVSRWYTSADSFGSAFDLVVADGTHLTSVDVYLTDATNSISGTIRYANDAAPIAGATVEFFDAAGDGSAPVDSVVAEADGSYVVADLPYGTYRVRASADPGVYAAIWYTSAATFAAAFDLSLGAGTHLTSIDVYLTDAPDQPNGDLRGTIRDGVSGEGLAGATVEVFDALGDGTTPVASTATGADGAYELLDLAPGSYRLRASSAGLIAGWYSTALDFDTALDIPVSAGSSLSGYDVTLWSSATSISGRVVTGESGDPLAGADVGLFDASGDGSSPVATASADADGRYAFADVPDGAYRVRAAVPGRVAAWYGGPDFDSAAALWVSGSTHLTGIDVPLWETLNSLGGTLRQYATGEPVVGATVELHPEEPGVPLTTLTGSDGSYVFEDVPEGLYAIRFIGGPGALEQPWYVHAFVRDDAATVFLSASSHLSGIDGYLGQPYAFPETGVPLITGTAEVGAVLSVDPGTWSPEPDSFTYQWLRNGIEIPGATGPTYVVQLADRGRNISVNVLAVLPGFDSGLQGSNQIFIPSATAAEIAAALDVDSTMQVSLFGAAAGAATSAASFSGFPRAGADYAVLSTGYASDVMLPAEPDAAFLSSGLGNGAGVDGNDLTGITIGVDPPEGASCLAIDLRFGSEEYPEFVGSAYNDVFTAETPTTDISKSGSDILAPNNYAFDAAGNILSINAIVGFAPVAGNAMDGWTPGLTARIPLAAGESDVILTIQDIGDSSYDSAVLLDNVRYVPTAECEGGGGATSTDPIVGTTPTISGEVTACTVVTAEPGAWAPAPVELAYQWRVDGVDVEGATEASWQIPPGAVGHAISVVVTGTKTGFLPVSLESAPATVEPCALTSAVPEITGVAIVGETLEVDPGDWSPDPVALSFEWLRDGVPIAGASGTQYVLVEDDLGALISVRVTGSKLGYATVQVESASIGPVLPADEPETLTIRGTVIDGLTGAPVEGAAVSAYAADGAGDVPIATATTAADGTYVLGPVPAQAYRLSAAAGGYATTWYLSAVGFADADDVGSELGGEAFASMNLWLAATEIHGTVREWSSGEPIEGAAVTLHPVEPADAAAIATTSTDADGRYRFADPAPGTYVIRFSDGVREQWFEDAATRETATPVDIAAGQHLLAVDGALGSPLEFDQAPKPVIVGTPAVGQVLSVDLGTWLPTPDSFEYEWLRDGAPIAGATGATYTVTLADRGTGLSVRVTGIRAAYAPASRTSDPVEVPAVSAADFGAAIDLDDGMSVVLEGDGAGYSIGTGPLGPFPGVGGSYGVLSTGNAGAVLMPAEPEVFLSTDLVDGPTGVDGHDLVRAVITVAPPGGAACLAIDFQFGSEEFPEYVGSSFNDVFTIETPSSDISLDGSAIVAPNNFALDTDGRVISINSIVVFAPLAGNALDGWTPGLTALVPVTGSAAQVVLTIQDLGDDAFDSAVLLDGVRFEADSACAGGGGVTPTDPITGPTPTVTGDATACGVLSVDPGAWQPAPVELGIQWLLDGEAVAGATESQFTIPADAVGAEVTVRVTGSKPGYPDVAMLSTPLTVVACTLSPAPTPTISGTPVMGGTLTADPGTWGPAPVGLGYQWLRDGVPIAGADGTELVLGPDDVGASITVAVTGSKPGYADATRTSDPAGPVAAAVLAPTPTPVVTGTASVGGTLTVDPGTWGPAPVQLSIRWLRDGIAIAGADGLDLVLTGADAGALITAEVTGTKPGYGTVSRTSDPVGPVAVPVLDPAPVPTITGQARVGSTLTAVPGTWGPAPVALAYQWLRDGTPIPDATSSTYALGAADLDTTISVTVTGSKTGYQSAERTSTGVGPVLPGTLTAPTPTISGVVAVGSVLTVVPGTWGPAPVQLTYQWFAGGSPRGTATTYTPTSADVGLVITVAVTGTKPGYTTVTRTSAATIAVPSPPPPPPPTLTAPTPTISGTPILGNTLTVVTGTWGPAPVALAIQWLRNGSPIGGATGTTHVLGTQDVGAMISVRVTGTKTGYVTAVRTSAQVGPVTLRPFDSAPVPTISGTPRVANVLTANPGAWAPAPTKLTYQWYRNGVAIPGATSSTWLLNGADFDRRIHVVVTAERNGYLTTSRASAQTPNILPGFMTATPEPWISGQVKVGSTLRVHTGQWEPAPVPVVFTWRRDGVPIPGQSGGSDFWTYTLRPADLGHRITVTVTSVKTGYVSVTRVTPQTAVVTNKK